MSISWNMPQQRAALLRFRSFAAAVFPWAGGILLGMAAGFTAHSWLSTRGLVAAEATVTENVASLASGGGIVYTPRLRFRAADGAVVLVLIRRGGDDIEFPAGKTVPVLYPRNDPQRAVIATPMRVYSTAVWLALTGVVMFDVGLVLRRTGSSGRFSPATR